MSDLSSSLRRVAITFGAAICIICGATALVCGAYIALRGGLTGATDVTFYLSGESAESDVYAVSAECIRRGGAGVICDGFVAERLYTDKTQAQTAGEVLELTVVRAGAGGENAQSVNAFYSAAVSAVRGIEKLTNELDEGRTSESLASLTVNEYAVELAGYSGNAGAIAAKSASVLIGCAVSGDAVGVKRAAVMLALLLSGSD